MALRAWMTLSRQKSRMIGLRESRDGERGSSRELAPQYGSWQSIRWYEMSDGIT